MLNRPRTILMTADCMGGVWTYAMDLASALARFDATVALATMGRLPSETQAAEARALPNLRLDPATYRLEWMSDAWEDVAAAGDWLLDLERRLKPDVVHLNGYMHASLPWRAPVLVVGHSCVCSWWQAVRRGPLPEAAARYRREVAAGLRGADAVVAPTGAMLDALESHYGGFHRAGVIHNGRDARHFTPGEPEPFVLAAGRVWDEAKNLAALDAVAADLPWPVRIAGPRRHPDDGTSMVLRHAEALGPLPPDRLGRWLGRAAIYAAPARYEPFGLGPLEAALAGCALVLGDIASLREVWADAACYVPPDDAEALRDAIHDLIRDPQSRRVMAHRAREQAQHYTPLAMAGKYSVLYDELIGGRDGAARPMTARRNRRPLARPRPTL